MLINLQFILGFFALGSEEAVTVPEVAPPINAYLLVDSRQLGELHISIPDTWSSFEVQVSDWTPITCDIASDCAQLSVFAHADCDTASLRFTVQTDTGVRQYWQSVSCVNVPIQVPDFRGQDSKAFVSPRRKWR